jgi:hypothetical protein
VATGVVMRRHPARWVKARLHLARRMFHRRMASVGVTADITYPRSAVVLHGPSQHRRRDFESDREAAVRQFSCQWPGEIAWAASDIEQIFSA